MSTRRSSEVKSMRLKALSELRPPVEIRVPITTVLIGQLPYGSKVFSVKGDSIKWYIKTGDSIAIHSCRKQYVETLRDVETISSVDKQELMRLLKAFK